MDVPVQLLEEMRRGRVVLCLGAGASVGAAHPGGEPPPLASALGHLLADRFLGTKHRDRDLAQIAEYAQSESSLRDVQAFVRDLFEPYSPGDHHMLIPTFRWRAIFSTNYDLVIERTYERHEAALQRLRPVVADQQRIDDVSRSPDDLLLYKLHGCITRADDTEIPLILTTDQYLTHRNGRRRLFERFVDLGHECPIVFIGHGLQDMDIRSLFKELEGVPGVRPRFYLVKPSSDDVDTRFWESKRVTVLHGTLTDFLQALDAAIPRGLRGALAGADLGDHPLAPFLVTEAEPTERCTRFIHDEVDFVRAGMPVRDGAPSDFYRGFDVGWIAIQEGFDIRRSLTDEVLSEAVLVDEVDRPSAADLYAVLAEAGAGKTTFLRRLAVDAARDWDALCFFLRRSGRLDNEGLAEIHRLTGRRVFLFVDDAADHARDISSLINYARRHSIPVTVVTTERKNEWNESCALLEELVQDIFALRYLSASEINDLVDKLEQHESLGHLARLNPEQRIEEFTKRAGRQLLVALHEATEGRPFEDILEDEYHHISPAQARSIYLAICIVNRLGGLVRAGVIFRAFGIPFAQFEEEFFRPLERVVQVAYDPPSGDYGYRARHPEIAAIVFDKILKHEGDRFSEVARILNSLNVSFQSDFDAYKQLIRARSVMELFPNYEAARELYEIAKRVAPEDPYRLHQQGIFEMRRTNPSYDRAYELLREAETLAPHDKSVKHSLAELQRKRALKVSSHVRRAELRNDARRIASELLLSGGQKSYPRHTLVKLAMDELREATEDLTTNPSDLERAIERVEQQLERGLQEAPDDPAILASDAELRRFLRQDERLYEALEAAFKANRRNSYIASRLAQLHQEIGDLDRAAEVLSISLEADRGNKHLHFKLAMILRHQSPPDLNAIVYHLRRSYAPDDANVEAQFWHARFMFERNAATDRSDSKAIFKGLRDRPLDFEIRTRIRDEIRDPSGPRLEYGRLTRKDDRIGWITWAGTGEELFVHSDNVDAQVWSALMPGTGVAFNIAFNFSGPLAIKLQPQ